MSSFDGEIVTSGIVQADVLQQYVDTLHTLVEECKILFDDGGLSAAAVDPANVCMVDADLSKTAFESYDSPGSVRIGINLASLDEKLGSAKADDIVEFGVDMETRHLKLRYRNVTHEMGLIDPDAVRNEPDMPDIDLPNYVEIQSDALDEAASNVELVSDHIWVRGDVLAGEGELELYAEGDIDRASLTFDADDLAREEIREDAESLFSLEYTNELIDPIPKGIDVGVAFGDEFPTIWKWSAFDGDLTVENSLAPRIQSD